MHNRLSVILTFMFAMACSSSGPALVPVLGTPEDLVPLTGEWSGTYESGTTGNSGSITFHLTEDPKGAHGDVMFIPRRDLVYSRDEMRNHPAGGGSVVLAIEFVRIAAGEISGRIASYADPETPDAMLETHFAGHLAGDRIEGTFVTYSDRDVTPRRGRWSVKR